ncbi:MAG TPA: DNA topoisomerase IV subunit B [Oligoflexia bacterium]|nr:DNA topoisomerase IV subunit B [Oligoflexia bacterium]HMP49637.1 DNA topoisomerase IV subunit B [Oligoflexia bacterium]
MSNAVKKEDVKKDTYSAADIEVLEGLEAVRRRPGMYIAGTDTTEGLHQLVLEILDNSVDEAMNGHATTIKVLLHHGATSVSVQDNGRGIPVDVHPKFKKSALEIILTTLHAGGKFSSKNYTASGGLHGVGSSVVNALSNVLRATVLRDGSEYYQEYSHGVPKSAVKKSKVNKKGSGTTIFFEPDFTIFRLKKFDPEYIREKIKIKAFLNPGLEIEFVDEESGTADTFCYERGVAAYLEELIEKEKMSIVGEIFTFEVSQPIPVSVALVWTEQTREMFYSYVNGIYTSDGGTHEQGVKNGIVKAVRNYLSVHDLLPKGLKLGAEDIREGLVCILSIKMPSETHQPQFQGQTKSKLNNPEITPLVESALRVLEKSFNERPSVSQAIVERVFLAARARAASRAAVQQVKRKVGLNQRMTLPGKLADCSSSSSQDTELFLVEGDSAGGSTKQGRDRKIQAVLPLRGKVLNTISSNDKKIGENKELGNIIAALGAGVGRDFQISRVRYGKIIILTDADADGMHIGTLLLAFFFTQMRELIEAGRLYLGKPPLYGIHGVAASSRGKKTDSKSSGKTKGSQKDDDVIWAYSDAELKTALKNIGSKKPRIVRYKGLGEMNPETLWSTTLDPAKRTLLQVHIEDFAGVQKGFESLMGSDSSARYRLIQDSPDMIELDI